MVSYTGLSVLTSLLHALTSALYAKIGSPRLCQPPQHTGPNIILGALTPSMSTACLQVSDHRDRGFLGLSPFREWNPLPARGLNGNPRMLTAGQPLISLASSPVKANTVIARK